MTRTARNESGTDLQHYEDAEETTVSRNLELGRYEEDEVATLPWLPLVDRNTPTRR
jgi:hypothetical protein